MQPVSVQRRQTALCRRVHHVEDWTGIEEARAGVQLLKNHTMVFLYHKTNRKKKTLRILPPLLHYHCF